MNYFNKIYYVINLAVIPNHEPIFYEVGYAQNTIGKTGNSLLVMGYTQNLRWVIPNKFIFLSSSGHDSLHNSAERFDQQMDAGHLLLGNIDIIL